MLYKKNIPADIHHPNYLAKLSNNNIVNIKIYILRHIMVNNFIIFMFHARNSTLGIGYKFFYETQTKIL